MNIQIKTIKQDDSIMKILEISTINRVICNTNKGVLTLQIRKGDNNYHLVLDAVPLLPDVNKELMQILFPIPQVIIPQVKKEPEIKPETTTATPPPAPLSEPASTPTKKKGGRPKKVKIEQ